MGYKFFSKWFFGFCILLYICFSFIGCQISSRSYEPLSHELYLIDDYRLPLDSEMPLYSLYSLSYQEGDSNFIFDLNHIKNNVSVYDADNASLLRKFYFEKEGPGSLGQIQAFKIVNKDSLIVFPKRNLVNTVCSSINGKSNYFPFRLKAKIEDNYSINHASTSAAPPIFFQNKWYFIRYPLFDIFKSRNMNEVFQYGFTYDSSGIKMLNITLPLQMQDKVWTHLALGLGGVKGHDSLFIYNWPILDSLIVTDHDKIRFSISADLINDFPLSLPLLATSNERPKDLELYSAAMEGIIFPNLYYDSYRKVYYRFARIPKEYDPTQREGFDAIESQDLAIIVLDTNFQKIAELYLPQKTYRSFPCFIGPKGLYIPKLHPDYKDLNEDYRDYGVYQIHETNENL